MLKSLQIACKGVKGADMSIPHDPEMLAKAETLTEALPYLQRYAGRTFVVKYGGHAMGEENLEVDYHDFLGLGQQLHRGRG